MRFGHTARDDRARAFWVWAESEGRHEKGRTERLAEVDSRRPANAMITTLGRAL